MAFLNATIKQLYSKYIDEDLNDNFINKKS